MTQAKGIDEENLEPQARGRSEGLRFVSTRKVCMPPTLGRASALMCVGIGFESLWLTLRTPAAPNRDLLEVDSQVRTPISGQSREREFRS